MTLLRSRKFRRLSRPAFALRLGALAVGLGVLAASAGFAGTSAQASAVAVTSDASAAMLTRDRRVGPMPSLAPVIERVQPAVVSIHAFGGAGSMTSGFPRGMGSGFIVSKDGVVVTNHHVVAGSSSLEVKLADGRRFKATLLGSDQFTDLAVLKIEGAKKLPTLSFGNSSGLRVGDYVIAIGSPLGLESTVTTGIVSAKGRGDLGLYRDSYLDFVQTDAAISPGSSGGPLVDLDGRVIAVNTAVAGPGNGLGFSIPIDQAKIIIPQLRDNGRVARGWLGVAGRDIRPALGGDEPLLGAVVGEVMEGSPADEAGLRSGDVIMSVDGNEVDSFADLRGRIAMMAPDSKLTLNVRRGDKQTKLRVVLGDLEKGRLGARTRRPARTKDATKGSGLYDGTPSLGVAVQETPEGLVVRKVEPGGIGGRLDLRVGDIVREINGQKIREVADVRRALSKAEDRVRVTLKRDGATHVSMLEIRP
ncbi:MAG: trypsin-like peptidase domain-containing protein [Nannocystaceae bacterium]